LATSLVFGNKGVLEVAGIGLSPAAGMASVIAGSQLAGSFIADEAAKSNTADEYDESVKMVLEPAIVGACTVAAGRVFIGNYETVSGMGQILALGAASSAGGKYVSDVVVPK
jgi:anti-sigma factor RsiW